MVNRVSTVRKLLFLLFCHVGFVTSQKSIYLVFWGFQ